MPREQHQEDFSVEVDGIGTFHFGRRKKTDHYKIRSLYGRMTDHNYTEEGKVGDMAAWMDATLQILTVSSPKGFSLEKILDPLTAPDDGDEQLLKIYTKLREKELSFRPQTEKRGAGEGEDTIPEL